MTYPIDLYTRQEQNHVRTSLSHAHDLGFDLALRMVIDRLESLDDWDEIDTAFVPEIIEFIKKNFGIKDSE